MGLRKKSAKQEAVATEQEGAAGGTTITQGGECYMVSVWSGNDGKYGCGIKYFAEPRDGETPEQMAARANKFGVLKLRELERIMGEEA